MRYVLYRRVSSNAQASDGQGLEIQEETGRAWLRAGRHRLVEVCTDSALSGSDDVAHRPGLARALALVIADKADGILVPRLDRLARDVILQEQLLAELHRIGKELRSCSPTEDHNLEHTPDDPTRALVRRILGAVAQYERELIRLRLKSGRERKLMRSGYIGGTPPYGWAAVRGELVPVPDEQRTIRLIRRLRAEGRSYRAICAELERRGIVSRARHRKWRPATVQGIYQRPDRRKVLAGNVAAPSPELSEVTA